MFHKRHPNNNSLKEAYKEYYKMNQLYFCYVENSHGCKHPHIDEPTAKNEARRLARLPNNIGKKVYILKAISYCEVKENPVEWTELK